MRDFDEAQSKPEVAAGCITLLVPLCLCLLVFLPLNLKTRVGGEHTGYITAVETNVTPFWFNNTTTVYVKTELSSSQEDTYCVPSSNGELVRSLKDAATKKQNVKIHFDALMMTGIGNCDGDTITGVAVLDLSQTH